MKKWGLEVLMFFMVFISIQKTFLVAQQYRLEAPKVRFNIKTLIHTAETEGGRNPKLIHGSITVEAQYIVLNEAEKIVYGQTNLVITDEERKVKIYGDSGKYEVNKRFAQIEGNVKIFLEKEGETIKIYGKDLKYYGDTGTIYLGGDVKIEGKEFNAESKNLYYYTKTDIAELTGNPVVKSSDTQINANKIKVYIVQREYIKYFYGLGNVRVESPRETLIANEIWATNNNRKEIEKFKASGNAIVTNKERNEIIKGEGIIYDKPNGYTRVEGGNPYFEEVDKKMKIYALFLERTKGNEIVARGNLEVISPNFHISGSMLSYNQETGIAKIFGPVSIYSTEWGFNGGFLTIDTKNSVVNLYQGFYGYYKSK